MYILERFLLLRIHLITLRTGEDGEEFEELLTDGICSQIFFIRIQKWVKMLQDIDQVTLLLQKRMITLSKTQRLLANLLLDINTASLNVNARLHNCLLGSKWIGAESHKLKSSHFHGGVIKIQ